MSEHQKILVEILGKDASFSTDFKVTDNVRVLVNTVNYLFTQLGQIQRMMQEDDKDYIATVELNAIEILKGNKNNN